MGKTCLIVHLAHWDQLLGGAEIQLKYLSEFLLKNGYDVHLIFPIRNSIEINFSKTVNHPISLLKLPGTFGKTWFLYKSQLEKKIKYVKPSIIITRSHTSWAGIAASYAQKKGIKHLHFIASDRVCYSHNRISAKKFFDLIENKLANNVFNSSSEIIAQHIGQKQKIQERFGIESKIIPQAAPLNNPNKIVKSKNRIKVLWIANLKPLKRPEVYLEIANSFKDCQEIEFIMIGADEGNKYDHLFDKYRGLKNFTYMGYLYNENVNEILDRSHILINTSDYEGFSNTFIQAWLREVVVISLNSDPGNVLCNEKLGFLTRNSTNTILQLQELLKNRQTIWDIGRSARKYALKNHCIDQSFRQLTF